MRILTGFVLVCALTTVALSQTNPNRSYADDTDPTGRLLEVVTEGEEDVAGTYHGRVSRVYLKKK